MRLGYYVSWFFWFGVTQATLDTDEALKHQSLLGVSLYLVRRAGISAIGAIRAGMSGNLAGAVESALDVAFSAGYARRVWQMPRSRETMVVSGARR
jgi:hypothetical protein